MPGSHHLPRATPKEDRMYEHIKIQEEAQGKAADIAKRIAAATTNKYRAKHGETKKK
jgi:hypothetical protein